MTEGFGRVNEGLVGLTAIVGQLAASQLRTDEQLRATKERVDDLGEYIRNVGSHLNVVIEMFEQPARRSWRSNAPAKVGHLRDDHGRPPS